MLFNCSVASLIFYLREILTLFAFLSRMKIKTFLRELVPGYNMSDVVWGTVHEEKPFKAKETEILQN